MAVISSPLNFKKLTRTTEVIKKGVSTAGKSLLSVGKIIFNNTKVKRDSYSQTKTIKGRRVEYEERRKIEDELEAPDRVKTESGPSNLAQSDTTKGFFERITGFVGYLAAGWILNNIPTWIGMGKEFIARLQKAGQILSGFFDNTLDLFNNFGRIMTSLGQNIITLDLFDSSNRLKTSFDGLNISIGKFGDQLTEALSLITTPLSQGKYSEQQIPGLGTQQQNQGAYKTQSPNVTGSAGGGEWKPLLDLIASGESTSSGGYDAMHPNRNTRKEGRPVSEMTITQAAKYAGDNGDGRNYAVGRYQFTTLRSQAIAARLNPDKDVFSPVNQDRIAINILEVKRHGKKWLSGKISDEEFSEYLAREWGALRSAKGKFLEGNSGHIGFDKIKPVLQKVKRNATVPSSQPQQINQVPVGNINPRVGDRLGAGRGHGGVDLQVNSGTPLRAVSDGVIVDSDSLPGGWGNFLVMKDNMGIYHLYGHMQPGYKRGGSVKKGEVIGKVGSTGNSSGPHLHWETGTGWTGKGPGTGGVISGRFDALTRYSKFAPFNTEPESSLVSTTPAQISPADRQQLSSPTRITPERRGQNIIIAQQPSQQTVVMSGGGGGGDTGVTPASNQSMLNNFIKNKLLLDLAYL